MIVLRDLLPAVASVTIGRTQVEVFGIGLDDLGVLLEKYEEPLKGIFNETPGKNQEVDFTGLAKRWPELVTDVITAGLRVQGQEEDVKRIPLTTQLEILKKVWELTVDDPKKLTTMLRGLADAASRLRSDLNA
jgi:hypothetical protein